MEDVGAKVVGKVDDAGKIQCRIIAEQGDAELRGIHIAAQQHIEGMVISTLTVLNTSLPQFHNVLTHFLEKNGVISLESSRRALHDSGTYNILF